MKQFGDSRNNSQLNGICVSCLQLCLDVKIAADLQKCCPSLLYYAHYSPKKKYLVLAILLRNHRIPTLHTFVKSVT